MDTARLLEIIRHQFALDWNGIHGITHWMRVRDIGLRLAAINGANPRVVELFAFFHDSRRTSDGHDPDHGRRGALLAQELAGSEFTLDPAELALLVDACNRHSDGLTTGDLTVLTCWDSDRLDLGRVGIAPQSMLLCTEAARRPELINWAYRKSLGG